MNMHASPIPLDLARAGRSSESDALTPARHGPWRAWVARWRLRAELRRLLRLGVHLIDDIGMRLEAAETEAAKPFWQR